MSTLNVVLSSGLGSRSSSSSSLETLAGSGRLSPPRLPGSRFSVPIRSCSGWPGLSELRCGACVGAGRGTSAKENAVGVPTPPLSTLRSRWGAGVPSLSGFSVRVQPPARVGEARSEARIRGRVESRRRIPALLPECRARRPRSKRMVLTRRIRESTRASSRTVSPNLRHVVTHLQDETCPAFDEQLEWSGAPMRIYNVQVGERPRPHPRLGRGLRQSVRVRIVIVQNRAALRPAAYRTVEGSTGKPARER